MFHIPHHTSQADSQYMAGVGNIVIAAQVVHGSTTEQFATASCSGRCKHGPWVFGHERTKMHLQSLDFSRTQTATAPSPAWAMPGLCKTRAGHKHYSDIVTRQSNDTVAVTCTDAQVSDGQRLELVPEATPA